MNAQDAWAGLSETKDIHEHWNKTFKDNGIFEGYAAPYNIVHKRLTLNALKSLKEEHGGWLFSQIMEILRHNTVSDKPNAFNKMLNLFICKIYDEVSTPDDEELLFQCWNGLSDEDLQMTLNDLYKDGVRKFLDIEVSDYTTEQIESLVNSSRNKEETRKAFMDMRLKKSPNFAFSEVLEDRSFRRNAKVVREMVELLQGYRFRYEQKHSFLGDFFERLLNTSIKQEAGQFFTPPPITRFIISSIPVREMTQKMVSARSSDLLPAVIDFACGSGHFLTEYMSRMQLIIENLDKSKVARERRGQLESWGGDIKFSWARDYVYGIDSDDRLVKTTKVSAYFNGDGEANIVWADGLDAFDAKEYRGRLKKMSPHDKRDNGQFDILVSNPPFSVEKVKRLLQDGSRSFELFDCLTDNSSEIECLFVERMKQLLKSGGLAGVILPSSMLSNSGIYSRAREIIFRHFKVKAIVELGSGTFMKTGTNTVVLFLERRADSEHESIEMAISMFFKDGLDVTAAGIEHAFSRFVADVYDDLAFEDYVSLISGRANAAMQAHELWLDYVGAFGGAPYEKALEIEREKMRCFLMTYKQNIVLVKSGQKQDEKAFLGYEFSERRRHEGIKYLSGGTKLFDESGDVFNPQKVNSYIYNAFLGKPAAEVDEAVAKHVSYGRMSSFFEYGTWKFDKRVNLNKKAQIISSYPTVKLEDLLIAVKGATTKIQLDLICNDGNIPVVTQNVGELISGYCDGCQPVTDTPIIVMGDHTCIFKWVDFHFVRGADGTQLLKIRDGRFIPKFVYYILCATELPNKEKYERHHKYLADVRVPLLPLDVQRQVVAEFEALERDEQDIAEKIQSEQSLIDTTVDACFAGNVNVAKLGDVAKYVSGRITVSELSADNYVGVDNLLPNIGGKTRSNFVPARGSATAFSKNDILLSNIRPYLKKAWLADDGGGCSGDVLVLRADEDKVLPTYLFVHLSANRFFDYEMQNIGSNVKMPRADKDKVLEYKFPLPPLKKQRETVAETERHKSEITNFRERLAALKSIKAEILGKYL
ncbi:MAG: N-6 DNA methylase [Clostridiales Family XIII bacterium]|nr:N-6 DNA methylase [Clostridiales Family XIII bacterium]